MEISKKELEKLILEKNTPYSTIGKLYGISGTAIKKKANMLGIPLPKRRNINSCENFSRIGFRKNSFVNIISDEEFKDIIENNTNWAKIGELLGYKKQISANIKSSIENRCKKLGIKLNISSDKNAILDKTKGEVFSNRGNWQSARSSIQKIARIIFFEENKNPKCAICGYDKHVDVAHIKAVSEFSQDSTIREINLLTNLIGLCPNHHWEYDHNLLDLKDFIDSKKMGRVV